MDERIRYEDCITFLGGWMTRITYELENMRRTFEDMSEKGWADCFTKTERKAIDQFLLACSLYETNQELRAETAGLLRPFEFLRALEAVVEKLKRM